MIRTMGDRRYELLPSLGRCTRKPSGGGGWGSWIVSRPICCYESFMDNQLTEPTVGRVQGPYTRYEYPSFFSFTLPKSRRTFLHPTVGRRGKS